MYQDFVDHFLDFVLPLFSNLSIKYRNPITFVGKLLMVNFKIPSGVTSIFPRYIETDGIFQFKKEFELNFYSSLYPPFLKVLGCFHSLQLSVFTVTIIKLYESLLLGVSLS